MRHDQREKLSTSSAGNLTGEDVYELDFSQCTTPGEYFVMPDQQTAFTVFLIDEKATEAKIRHDEDERAKTRGDTV